MGSPAKPFAIYHEHPDWFRPVFKELDRRGLPYVRLDPRRHWYDSSAREYDFSLLFNRMSPSAYLRDGVQGTFFTLNFVAHLESLGIPVVNGHKAFTYEISKALQLNLLKTLELPYPKSRVINHPAVAPAAAEGLRFPIVVKANIGGSGAGIVRYDSMDALRNAVAGNQLNFGIDHTALVQEFIPARNSTIVRVETLGRRYLYGIKIETPGNTFNLCPADICQRSDGVELVRSACPIDAPKSGMKVEGYTPPPQVVRAIESIVQAAAIDVGGIEYMVDDRDGALVYYDINCLSNFVADAPNVIGFDPFVRLVDYLELRARPRAEKA
jgi:hypothetical protein